MKAVVFEKFGSPKVLELKDQTKAKAGPSEVLIKMHVAGINPVETYIREGNFGQVPFPYILGTDGSGEIEEVGEGVIKFKKGDRVWTYNQHHKGTGTYAEYMACAATHVFRLPDNSSYKQGAALGIPYMTAAHAIFTRSKAKPSETILIHGASGGVGIAACQFAKAHGMTVIGTAGTEEGLKLVLENGAHYAFNHKDEGYQKKIMEITGGQGPNVILEMLANINLQKDLEMITTKGRITIIGTRGDTKISPILILMKECTVSSVLVLNINQDELDDYAARISVGLEQGWLKPVIGKEYPLTKASEAHIEIIKGTAKGKMVMNVV